MSKATAEGESMKASRDVYMTIGKSSYTIHTSLSVEDVDRVKELIDAACGEIVSGASQEEMLMLTCLRLAYRLEVLRERAREVARRLGSEG